MGGWGERCRLLFLIRYHPIENGSIVDPEPLRDAIAAGTAVGLFLANGEFDKISRHKIRKRLLLKQRISRQVDFRFFVPTD